MLLAAGALVLVFLAWGGVRLYLQRRDRKLVACATHAIDIGDYRSAWVWLDHLYFAHPNDVMINRLIARFDAVQHRPEELVWRERVVQLGPATFDDYVAWTSVALRLGQTGIACEALNNVPATWRENAAYLELYARAMASAGQMQAADDHLAGAIHIEPSNPAHAINLAALRLTADDKATRDAARVTLEYFADSAVPPLPAVRALLEDALRQGDAARIARFRVAMLRQRGRMLEDELLCVSTGPNRSEADGELAALWKGIAGNPPQALQVAEWMITRGESSEALDWLRKLPAAAQSDVGIQTAEADALAALRNWPGLRTYLNGKNWRGCEFLRQALLVRCARETHAPAPQRADAIAACKGNGSDLLLLAKMFDGWSWHTDAEALYWQVSEMGYPARGPALKALWNFYTAQANTGGLLHVAHEQFKDFPRDPGIRNNFAFLSLLTGVGTSEASRVAEENFHNQPENANIAATYAYSLYFSGRYGDGLRVVNHFGEQRMQAAGAMLYLALLQQAAGQTEAAAHSAASVDPRKLLPEEKALLSDSQRALTRWR